MISALQIGNCHQYLRLYNLLVYAIMKTMNINLLINLRLKGLLLRIMLSIRYLIGPSRGTSVIYGFVVYMGKRNPN